MVEENDKGETETTARSASDEPARVKGRAKAEFPQDVIRHVANEVLLLCSRPDCRRPCYGPTVDGDKLANVGTAAHMASASDRGPRANPSMPPEDRRSAKNAIWLCRDHGKHVDDDESAFTLAELQDWKRQAIEYALRCIAARTLDVDGRLRQIFQTRHELVKQLWPAVAELAKARLIVATSLARWRYPRLGDGEKARSRLSAFENKNLSKAIEAVTSLQYQVQGVFGEEVFRVVSQLCDASRGLSSFVLGRLSDKPFAAIEAAPRKGEPIWGGRAYERWMSDLTTLINVWCGAHLGRPGVEPMENTELEARAAELLRKAREEAVPEWDEAEDAALDELANVEEEYWAERLAYEEELARPIELGAAGRTAPK